MEEKSFQEEKDEFIDKKAAEKLAIEFSMELLKARRIPGYRILGNEKIIERVPKAWIEKSDALFEQLNDGLFDLANEILHDSLGL